MGLIDEDDEMPTDGVNLAKPITFLFDSDGKIVWSYVSDNYRIRPDTVDVLAAAEEHFGR